jgi:hypothetical protein
MEWQKMLVEMQLYVIHASLNRLKVQDFAGEPKSEFIAQNLATFVTFYDLVVTNCVITQQFMQYQLHSNEEYVRFFVKI